MSKHKHFRPIIPPANRPDARPNYRKVIEAALEDGTLQLAPGTLSVINVQYDDWCAIFQGEPCNCNPDIIQKPPIPPEENKAGKGNKS
jgi:hypothetical protein